MTKELAVKGKINAIDSLANKLQVNPESLKKTLMQTVFKDCNEAEFVSLVIIANTYGLNPMLKEMYAFKGRAGGVVPIVSVDGWISLVNRHPNFNGVELVENEDAEGKLISVTATFHLKGKDHPVVVTEYMDECFRETETWKRWKRRMLRHKAYIQGARIAFGFTGIVDPDEAERIEEATLVEKFGGGKPEVEMPQEKATDKPTNTPEAGESEPEIKFGE